MEVSEKREIIIKKIKKAIADKGWKPVDLARHLGIYKSTVSKWLNGKRKLTFDNLHNIEEALGITLIDLDFSN